MSELKKHQKLIELELLVKDILNKHTINANTNGYKHTFSSSFSFGNNKIEKSNGLISKDYYVFKLELIDKTSGIESHLNLYNKIYPTVIGKNKHKLHEEALLDFISNAIGGLIYIEFTKYTAKQMQDKIKAELEEDSKPKLILTS